MYSIQLCVHTQNPFTLFEYILTVNDVDDDDYDDDLIENNLQKNENKPYLHTLKNVPLKCC